MKYVDPAFGRMEIDLEHEEFPASKNAMYYCFPVAAAFFGGLGLVGTLAMLVSMIDYFDFSMLLVTLLVAGVSGGVAWLCLWGGKRYKKKYFEVRAQMLEQEKSRQAGIVREDACLLISGIEIGTNLMGWVRGIDRTNNLAPATVKVTFANQLGKEIKYLKLSITPYNAVGDPVACTVTGNSTYEVTCTGPFECGMAYWQTMNAGWYNNTIETAKIEGVEVIYCDDTSEVLDEKQIRYQLPKGGLSDNDSRQSKQALGTVLMAISGILDVVSFIGIFTMDSTVFSIVLFLSTATFFLGLKLRK